MCGITGLFAFNEIGRFSAIKISVATEMLQKRGPDYSKLFGDHFVHFGHTRLSIIDLDYQAHQPMTDETGRYTIIYNGEIFNFQDIKTDLINRGHTFFSKSDTEVLLKSYIEYGEKCLELFNGFFAFAIYDKEQQNIFLARDRMGVKPLLYYEDEDKFVFASEMKALLRLGIPKELDYTSLQQYLQFNYIPAPHTIFKGVKKLEAGHFLHVKKREVTKTKYYQIPFQASGKGISTPSYEKSKETLARLMEESVQRRLVSDVPLGSFLSGGIDSSVISTLAARHTQNLHTFSIGYQDEPFFDETNYANMVAKKIKSEHTVFSLKNKDFYEHLFEVLDYTDEPFADSSAIAMYILSKYTKKHIKVALSGDGADEMFGGYQKHYAEYLIRNPGISTNFIQKLLPLWQKLPQSRSGFFSNKLRQFKRFGEGVKLSHQERYWLWASFATEQQTNLLFSAASKKLLEEETFQSRKKEILKYIQTDDLNELLYTDMHLVLQNDMLVKVDWMSMANGLEVRNPFLDFHLVEFAFSIPSEYKVANNFGKKIVQDTFRDILPKELYRRGKKGFEVPLLKWLRTEMKDIINNDLLEDKHIIAQGIFDVDEIKKLKAQLFSSNPQDVHARIWALVVFQYWWKKYFS